MNDSSSLEKFIVLVSKGYQMYKRVDYECQLKNRKLENRVWAIKHQALLPEEDNLS